MIVSLRTSAWLLVIILTAVFAGAVLSQENSFTIDANALRSSAGTMLTVSGTVTCTEGGFAYNLTVEAFQGPSQNQVGGTGGTYMVTQNCTGATEPWEVTILAPLGQLWHNGRATARASIFLCDTPFDENGGPFACGSGQTVTIDQTLHINR